MNCGKNRGFTLIELLIVIAIIALLAAILFPVFSRARESARRSACQSNLKQVGLAIMQYVQDFDERFPKASTDEYNPPAWAWTIGRDYAKNTQFLQCPSEPFKALPESDGSYSDMKRNHQFTDYWINGRMAPHRTATTVVPISQVEVPAATSMAGDGMSKAQSDGNDCVGQASMNISAQSANHPDGGRCGVDQLRALWGGVKTSAAERHLGGMNVLFADGHVKFFQGSLIPGWDDDLYSDKRWTWKLDPVVYETAMPLPTPTPTPLPGMPLLDFENDPYTMPRASGTCGTGGVSGKFTVTVTVSNDANNTITSVTLSRKNTATGSTTSMGTIATNGNGTYTKQFSNVGGSSGTSWTMTATASGATPANTTATTCG